MSSRTVKLPLGGFCALPKGCFLALGCFDGLHVGHAALLKKTAELAAESGAPFAVWTPKGAKDAPLILGGGEKRALLAELGAEYYIEEEFARIKGLTPRAFFEERLIGAYGARGVTCGENFRFGKDKSGDAQTLAALCAEKGLACYIRPGVKRNGEEVSSAAIRAALKNGEIEKANELLYRPYGFAARAKKGRGVGSKIGYPTVNLPLPAGFMLPLGVYAADVSVKGGAQSCRAVVNVGVHPTFERANEPLCEAHLLQDPQKDLHGATVDVRFMARLRGEIAFSSAKELQKQIAADIEKAKKL